jgi:hypothetical protein
MTKPIVGKLVPMDTPKGQVVDIQAVVVIPEYR